MWGSIKELLGEANGENHRNFVEAMELQICLKNYCTHARKRAGEFGRIGRRIRVTEQ
jgi:hypothetical protein